MSCARLRWDQRFGFIVFNQSLKQWEFLHPCFCLRNRTSLHPSSASIFFSCLTHNISFSPLPCSPSGSQALCFPLCTSGSANGLFEVAFRSSWIAAGSLWRPARPSYAPLHFILLRLPVSVSPSLQILIFLFLVCIHPSIHPPLPLADSVLSVLLPLPHPIFHLPLTLILVASCRICNKIIIQSVWHMVLSKTKLGFHEAKLSQFSTSFSSI